MIKEAIDRILQLGVPNQIAVGTKIYVDKQLSPIKPAIPGHIHCSTLQGLVDLLSGELEDAKEGEDLFVVIESPTKVTLVGRKSDEFAQRQVFAVAEYPEVKSFAFGSWLDPESFIIGVQQSFQRVKVENADGTFAHDLDYVLGIASTITAQQTSENTDDGFTQRVAVKQGVHLKAETVLKPMVNLAPYRTFAEIDQVISQFVFRSRFQQGTGAPQLALFEGDGGRWKLSATAAIKTWLNAQVKQSPIIS